MQDHIDIPTNETVLGQKYAYATAALVLGIACFINLLGIEKGILAIVFGALAIRSHPAPGLRERRTWGVLGVTFGAIQILAVVLIIALNFDKVLEVIRMRERLGEGR